MNFSFGYWAKPVKSMLCQGKPVRPAPRRVGKHQRFIPPDKPVQIFAGVWAGSALRQAPRVSESVPQGTAPPHPIGVFAPRHWQSYWKGKPTQGEEKSMLLKWKPPKIVNGKDDDSLEAIINFMRISTNHPEIRCVG